MRDFKMSERGKETRVLVRAKQCIVDVKRALSEWAKLVYI
jgi:hypothetical protein